MDVLRNTGFAILTGIAICAPHATLAEVTRIDVASHTPVLNGKSFGDVGSYEKIVGKVFFSVDPSDPRNKAIVDLDQAPRDGAGRVLFSADLYVLARTISDACD
jgi:hypothetical protein